MNKKLLQKLLLVIALCAGEIALNYLPQSNISVWISFLKVIILIALVYLLVKNGEKK